MLGPALRCQIVETELLAGAIPARGPARIDTPRTPRSPRVFVVPQEATNLCVSCRAPNFNLSRYARRLTAGNYHLWIWYDLPAWKVNSYQKAIILFSEGDAALLESLLLRWATEDDLGREIVRNMNPLERFLPRDDMRELLLALLPSRDSSIAELRKIYAQECSRHSLRGGTVRAPKPPLIGRAVHRDSFANWLYREYASYFHTELMVGDFIDRLIRGDQPTEFELTILMSAWPTWVTWNEYSFGSDPFSFCESASAEEIKGNLGLDPERRWDGKALLLLFYHRQLSAELYRPTIADAALHRFFEPPPIGNDNHGWTKTWPPGMARTGLHLKPRPEALHRPLSIRGLVQPVRELS